MRGPRDAGGNGLRRASLRPPLVRADRGKAYEGQAHWLLFLFRCRRPIAALPPDIDEGRFGFFSRAAIDRLPIPETDRTALWPIYDRYRDRFVALKADCQPGRPVQVVVEEITPA